MLVKSLTLQEHSSHIVCVSSLPSAEGRIERHGSTEHSVKGFARRRVPTAQVPIERCGSVERKIHIGHARRLPSGNVAIECRGTTKHTPQRLGAAHIPAIQVFVEGDRGWITVDAEGFGKIGQQRNVPGVDRGLQDAFQVVIHGFVERILRLQDQLQRTCVHHFNGIYNGILFLPHEFNRKSAIDTRYSVCFEYVRRFPADLGEYIQFVSSQCSFHENVKNAASGAREKLFSK